ncbi:hypothetical protein RHOSPDRAFT_35150 [Rhodotorula sp. JG-1b]|nr:hypothetical protein RHOSPDRAFT_35150 [Rhodotorula sp. JG-1b]
MSPPLSSSFALATFLTLFVTLLASLSVVPVVHGQSAGLGLVQCAPAQVQVGGGSGPYTVSVLPAGANGQLAADAEPLETFPALNQSGVASWLVNVPSGTTVRLGVRDGTGAVSYSDPFTVQSGTSNDCLPASSAVPTSSATTSALSSSPSSFASSQPDSSASRSSLTATTGVSTSGSVTPSSMSLSSLRRSSSLTGSVTTQLSSSFASLSTTTTRPSISSTSSSSSTRTSSSSSSMTSSASAIDPSATKQLSSDASSLRPHAVQLTTWLSAALLILACA